MKYRKYFLCIPVILLTMIFCSCVQKGGQIADISPTEKSLMELSSECYVESQLSEIAGFGGSMQKLNAKYPIECLRENGENYRVSYLGENQVVVLWFDRSGNRCKGNLYSIKKLKSDFDGLTPGQALDEVRAIDPDGEYSFLYTGKNDSPKVSTHCTKDGYLITVEYNASNVIVRVDKELI